LADASNANLGESILTHANLNATNFRKANLSKARLWWANLVATNLTEANLRDADLVGAALVRTNFTDADLTGCNVFGVSAWKVVLSKKTKQQDLIITERGEPKITLDNIEIAQFVYLLLRNQKIRGVIDTITSKMVLILGRFTPDRKVVLDALRNELRNRDLLPVVFDFEVPASRDVTETIKVLAGLARFVIADITDATEVRAELHNIVRDFPSLAVQPILRRGHPEFVSLSHLKKFPWLLPAFEYDHQEQLLAVLDKGIIDPAAAKVLELRRSGK
jgi:Pentapeptide repeats (8 copies)